LRSAGTSAVIGEILGICEGAKEDQTGWTASIKALQDWIAVVGAKTGYIESFNARLRDELFNGEISYTLREAQIVIESWRRRPHASIGYKLPAPEVPAFAAWPAALDSTPFLAE
jgi:hypothetical protein